MKRNVRLEDISDGKLYTANDLVKADCHDCEGCSACCRGMASIVLDPYDVWQLCMGLGKTFVNTDQTEHTARRFSAWLPPIQCTLSGHQCMLIIQV